ncbi:MAG TPA: DUF1587 domain-containing protein, partial [Polyangiales bacterium]|nr:DUF1587 domain-containing protein [Polyangiales bacterium]
MSRSLWRVCWIFVASCTELPAVAPWTLEADEATADAAVSGRPAEHIAPGVTGDDAGATPDATTRADTAPDPLAEVCTPSARAMPRAPSRRLSRVEYNNTIRDLLG